VRVVNALERDERVFNGAILRVADRTTDDGGRIGIIFLAVGFCGSERYERQAIDEDQKSSGGDGDHVENAIEKREERETPGAVAIYSRFILAAELAARN
jgi:hypothetical protein